MDRAAYAAFCLVELIGGVGVRTRKNLCCASIVSFPAALDDSGRG